MSLFVAGTGTGVGKTLTSTAVMQKYGVSHDLFYWKPVQTGSPPENDTEKVKQGSGLPSSRFHNPFLSLPQPVSPHRAIEINGVPFSYEALIRQAREMVRVENLLIEGAGGMMVPLDRVHTWMDFVRDLELPVVISTTTGLGTINHTLLTIHALRSHKIEIAGIVFTGDLDEFAKDNIRTILDMSDVPGCGNIPVPGFDDDPIDLERFDESQILSAFFAQR